MRNSSPADPLGPAISHRRIVSAPSPDELRHVRRGQRSADRITEIHAKLFQFGAGHWGRFKLAFLRGPGGFPRQRILHYQPAGKTSRDETSRGATSGIEACEESR
jgi:hypothetical protein